MEDKEIIELFFRRDERAISASGEKYGAYCRSVAQNILGSAEDAEECLSDTLLRAWNAIPPTRPNSLKAYLAGVCRNAAFDRYRSQRAGKRFGGETEALLSELESCISGGPGAEEILDAKELGESINRFLRNLSRNDRALFVRRYYFAEPVADAAARLGLSPGGAAARLSRLRAKLRKHLEQEGFLI